MEHYHAKPIRFNFFRKQNQERLLKLSWFYFCIRLKNGFQFDQSSAYGHWIGWIPQPTSTSYGYIGRVPKTLENF